MTPYSISIVGTGYVGLCTAIGFASKGYKVVAYDYDHEKMNSINKGIPPFYEPNLGEYLQKVVRKGYLKCVQTQEEAILNTDITFITVGTPTKQDGGIELQFICSAAKEIGEALKKVTYHLVVVKSTVIPGTTGEVVKPSLEYHSGKCCGVDFGLCMNPEFLREGSAIHDTLHPDRIVIGEYDQKSGDILQTFFNNFYRESTPPIVRTNLPSAELTKYSNNAFLATKICFINMIANICQKIPNTDVTTIAKAMGLDKRISPLFLSAGLGFGGSCFPKDIKALIAFSESLGYNPSLLKAVVDLNDTQPQRAIELAKNYLGDFEGKRIAILGLAFKPDTDDIREARSILILNQLLKEGAKITVYDPAAMPNAKRLFGTQINYAPSAIECIKNAECCIIVTEWDEFKTLQPEDFTHNMMQPILIDGRRVYDPKQFSQKLKFIAIGVGKNTDKKNSSNISDQEKYI